MDLCVLCNESLDSGDVVTVNRGREMLISASVTRQDNLENVLSDRNPLRLHTECRKNYTRPSSIQASAREELSKNEKNDVPATLRRSMFSAFDFKRDCLLCGETADPEKEIKKAKQYRRVISKVHYITFIDKLRSYCASRNDEWSEHVKARIAGVIDLVAAEARYHKNCLVDFSRDSGENSSISVGRPIDCARDAAFQKMCSDLEKDDECQYALSELSEKLSQYLEGEEGYAPRYLKKKLFGHFGDDVTITELPGRQNVVCLKDSAAKIIYGKWKESLNPQHKEDRAKIVEAAAAIIREDIRSSVYDTTTYSTDGSEIGEQDVLPESLQTFLSVIIQSKHVSSTNTLQRRRQSIGEALVSACNPRSFISPLLLGIGVYLHRHYASRTIIDILSSFGLSFSYNEVQKYECSLKAVTETPSTEAFQQFAFDNADFNIRTIDGHNTFHSMGGIRFETPKSSHKTQERVPRLSSKTGDQVDPHSIPVLSYTAPSQKGLANITVREVDILRKSSLTKDALKLDYLWVSGYWLNPNCPLPSWTGYMQDSHTSNGGFAVSSSDFLPFINLNPGNLSCIYSALKFARSECDKAGQKTCLVTFDQPLHARASEMVAASRDSHNDFGSMVILLGGFHLIMSFLGAIGHIMAGSGLEEVWSTAYAKASIPPMLSGHAYSRSLRAHNLTQVALLLLVLEDFDELSDQGKMELNDLYSSFQDGHVTAENVKESAVVEKFCNRLNATLESKGSSSRTALLWIQYIRLVNIVRCFLKAERSGDFQLHLQSIREMLPFFHASGHFLYARSARFHLQQMEDLGSVMTPDEYRKFTSQGFFTIRRSNRFWCGVSGDLAIEQGLMRSMKTKGGLTTGPGITESTLSNWIEALPRCIKVCEALEDFSGVRLESSEQHVDVRESRKKRDFSDLYNFYEWFRSHNPFTERRSTDLISLASGVLGDPSINCEQALEVGSQAMRSIEKETFGSIHLKRKDTVKPLSSLSRSLHVRNERVEINPQQLFNRIICVMKNEDDLKNALKFELAPIPPALFDETSFRKTNKADLAKKLESFYPCSSDIPVDTRFVVDGGYILHAVAWPQKSASYSEVCSAYTAYIITNYGSRCTVVFDGYRGAFSTKIEEQLRRQSRLKSANIIVAENLPTTTSRDEFLSNGENKAQLIDLLNARLTSVGITVHQAESDADTLVAETAMTLSEETSSITVVATDTDILALLVARASTPSRLLMYRPGTSTIPSKCFDISEIQKKIGDLKNVLLFCHAMSGCDTTSSFYRKGKIKTFQLLQGNEILRRKMEVFNDAEASRETIAQAGESFVLHLYNKSMDCENLNELMFYTYKKTIARQSLKDAFQLPSLPPTIDAAYQHAYRVYLQVQRWLGNILNPCEWGWTQKNESLVPVPTLSPPAPEELLRLISCNCKKGCEGWCECRKAGMMCSAMCGKCRGLSCYNSQPTRNDDSDNEF